MRRCCLIHLKNNSTFQRWRYKPAISSGFKAKLLVRNRVALAGFVLDHHPAQSGRVVLTGVVDREHTDLIANNVGGAAVHGIGVAPLKLGVALGSRHEEGLRLVNVIQPAEVQISPTHQVECSSFERQVLQHIDLVGLAIGNVNEAGDGAVQVKQRVQLDGGLGGLKRRLGMQGQTQVHGAGVEGVDSCIQIGSQGLLGIRWSGHANQMLREVSVDLLWTCGIRICQRVSRNHGAAKSNVIQRLGLRTQVDFDVAQGLQTSQLRKRHGEELVQTRGIFDLVIPSMLSHARAKGTHGQIGHELRKHELALVHAGPSRISAKGHKSAPRRSNRDQTGIANYPNKSLTYEVLIRERWDTTDSAWKQTKLIFEFARLHTPPSDISDPQMGTALATALLLELVEGLPNGLDTIVCNRGVRLSVGRRQRIWIAKALCHNFELLVGSLCRTKPAARWSVIYWLELGRVIASGKPQDVRGGEVASGSQKPNLQQSGVALKMNIAVIPARGGSKRIPRKNVKDFGGRPMISWAIGVALQSGLFDRVIVSTDDAEIAAIAREWGAHTPFARPSELANDTAGTVPVIAHALRELKSTGLPCDYAACIYPCSPFLRAQDLHQAFLSLTESGEDFVYPVIEYPHPTFRAMRRCGNGKMEFAFPECEMMRTQDLEPTYHDAGQFYWGKCEAWLAEKRMHTAGIGMVMPSWRFVDIDNEDDWRRAELLFKLQGHST